MLKNEPLNDAQFIEFGVALRVRRKALNLTMQTVADQAGLSVGFISQVERGLTAPSLSSLFSLAEVLDADISSFLQAAPKADQTTFKVNRPTYSGANPHLKYERLSSAFEGSQLHSVIIHEAPGSRTEPISHRGEEMFFILEGEITVEIEGEIQVLSSGDSIHFDSKRVHSTWNHTSENASLLWCGTMDIFGDAPSPIHKKNTTSVHVVADTGPDSDS